MHVAGDEADFSLKRKRVTAIHRIALQSCLLTGVQPGSPQGSPNKKAKKGKISLTRRNIHFSYRYPGSPISRVKADLDAVALLGNVRYPLPAFFIPSNTTDSLIIRHLLIHNLRYPPNCAILQWLRSKMDLHLHQENRRPMPHWQLQHHHLFHLRVPLGPS